MAKLFGTDGVRGVYGKELTDELARSLGYYGTKVLTESHQPVIIIGMDTRESAQPLQMALSEGIIAAGGKVLSAGVIPTPAVAVLVKKLNADAGIVISASHNPYEFNGIKFFNNQGYKLPDETEEKIEKLIKEDADHINSSIQHLENIENPENIYLDFLNQSDHHSLEGKKIVLDCSNGALYKIAPKYFKDLGAEVISIATEPNGTNINLNCGSTHIDNLEKTVLKENADFGFAFDGDADRCLAVDEKGRLIDGDKILNLISRKMKSENKLNKDMVVITEMSNLGLPKALDQAGINCIRTDVGDRYVLEEMLENDYVLGGEQSGHIIKLDQNTTGDGLLTASILADIFAESELKPSELSDLMKVYPQVLENAQVNNKNKETYMDDPIIKKKIEEVQEHFKGNGRVYIRPSGTEPLVRVMIEGDNQSEIDKIAKETVDLIEERLN